jgi:TrfA protein
MADSKDTKLNKTTVDLRLDSALEKIKAIAAQKKIESAELQKKEAAKKKREAKKAAVAKATKAQLPLWPEAVRAVPNAVLRSALFSVATERESFKIATLIASVEGIEVRFQGTRPNQSDLDVWEMLLHLARLQPLSSEIQFTSHSLLKALGRGTGGKDHEELKQQIRNLAAGLVEITWTKTRKTFGGTLISSYFRDEETGLYVVKFNRDFGKLYASGHTSIDWEERKSLGRNNIAKWAHLYYSSHEQPYPMKVETAQRLCGSGGPKRTFRRNLRIALGKLADLGTIASWNIDDETDLVSVTRKALQKLKK